MKLFRTNFAEMASKRARLNQMDKDSDEYKRLRERNNQAVKKSRTKSRVKAALTQERVSKLRDENKQLHDRVDALHRELGFFKELFLDQAGANGQRQLEQMDLSFLNDDDSSENHNTR